MNKGVYYIVMHGVFAYVKLSNNPHIHAMFDGRVLTINPIKMDEWVSKNLMIKDSELIRLLYEK